MTSPIGGGSEHVSRYRALGEFDNLVRAAREAKRALKELREEESKLNAQSLADDKKIAASKQARAKAERDSADAAKRSVADLNKGNPAGKAGEDAGTSYNRGVGRGIEKDSRAGGNRQFLAAATNALKQAFANAGEQSGAGFIGNVKAKIGRDSRNLSNNSDFDAALKAMRDKAGSAGTDTGNRYIMGFASKIRDLNNILHVIGFDELDLDVSIEDAQQSIKALEFELTRLSHTTTEPRVRIDTNRALDQLRGIQKLFKDEVADAIIKDSERIRKELIKIDELPSGKSFKFWALTAIADMTRVYEEADRGVGVFNRLRTAIASSGGGGGNNIFRSLISGFDDFSESTSRLLQRLGRVSGELYRMPGVIAVLVSAIPALVAGLGALGGGALGLTSALGAMSGFLAAGPGVITAFATTILALNDTFSGLKDTLTAARKAQAEEAEAKEKSRLGTDKALTSAQKYQLALAQLGEETGKFTTFWVEFGEKYADVQKVIQENFFREITDEMENLESILPSIQDLLGGAASAVGKVASEGIRMVSSGPWKRDFSIIAKDNAINIENMGMAGLALAEAFKDITVAAGPFTQWVTGSIKEGAEAFSDWAARARSDGTIVAFLGEAQESGQKLWVIMKNLGSVVNSFFASTVDEGQKYLDTLGDITGRWADVAEAQEAANSPLRQWMTNIRPILSALGDLIADLARGIGGLASNQSNITSMIDLLNSLRTDVLPPILEIIQHLNDSGIAVTVTRALGDMLQAISDFLDSGATTALTVFVSVLANFAELLFNIASLPVISHILGGLASSIAALAAVSIVARFTGLFKLWDFFTWMTRNRGNLSGAFSDAARGVAGLPTSGQTQIPTTVPSTVRNTGIGSEVLEAQARATERVGTASGNATGKVSAFSRAVAGITSAGNTARGALSNLSGFLGGPWGVALTAAAVGVGFLASHLSDQKQEVKDTKDAFLALKNAYSDIAGGNTENVNQLAETNEKFKDIVGSAAEYGLTLRSVSGALNNNDQDLSRVNAQLDAQITNLEGLRVAAFDAGGPMAALPFKEQRDKAIEFKNAINDVANAQGNQNTVLQQAASTGLTYQERLAGMTQAQVDNRVAATSLDDRVKTLSGALDVMASASSSAAERARALSDVINHEKGEIERANEATENWNSRLLDLQDSVKANGRALDTHSRQGLRNRDALQAAAKATRDLYLEDIASGVPMDQALKRHRDRIRELEKEAGKAFGTRKETRDLIKAYGDVPDDINTDIKSTGFQKVYNDLRRLQYMQDALRRGLSPEAAESEWKRAEGRRVNDQGRANGTGGSASGNGFYGRGDGYGAPGFANGGPVWGQGTRTSDSIRAWLSNGEFVQPTDAVEHYGLPVMEALRTRKLDRAVIEEALPDSQAVGKFNSGGQAHSHNCPSCSSGGHGFAKGGGYGITVPMPVNLKKTMVNEDWVTSIGGIGNGGGGNGWQWQMAVLRQAFPGLRLISGPRPGARTLSGNRSYHALGRAVDLEPRRDVAQWIRNNYGARSKELITPYNDLNLHNGRPHRYTGAVWNQHNFAGGNAHNHWAFNQGGLVDLMNMMGMQNLAPQQSAPLPTTPRSLSSAASGVVNNSTDNTRTFGDVIINNPAPERAGDSVRDALYRSMLLY